jgi:neutral ceramidase
LTWTMPRSAALSVPATGVLRAGAAQGDITPRLGLPAAGYGPVATPMATGVLGRLRCCALVLDDGAGGRVALVTVDLLGGSRYIVEKVAAALAPSHGLSIDRIFFAGSHTHQAPGHLFADDWYDGLASPGHGFWQDLADELADRVADVIASAAAGMKDARVGYAAQPAWGVSWNHSVRAFRRNIGAGDLLVMPWNRTLLRKAATAINGTLDPDTPLYRQLCDVNVHVVWAEEAATGTPIGAFATMGAHSTLIHERHAFWSSDSFGLAANLCERALRASHPGSEPVVGLAAGTIGDVDLVSRNRNVWFLRWTRWFRRGSLTYVREAGRITGKALIAACQAASAAATTTGITIRCDLAEPVVRGAPLAAKPWINMASDPAYGLPVLQGSEIGRNFLDPFVREGMFKDIRVWRRGDPHWPKLQAGALQRWLIKTWTNDGDPLGVIPIRFVDLGIVTLVGLPGEPNTWLGVLLREKVRLEQGDPTKPVVVAGPCGDYVGYLATRPEFEAQHYEGASTIWGRWTSDWLQEQVADIARHGSSAPGPVATFTGPIGSSGTALPKRKVKLWFSSDPSSIRARNRGGRLELDGWWTADRNTAPLPHTWELSPLVQLEMHDPVSGTWKALEMDDLPVNDANMPIAIEQVSGWSGVRWCWNLALPPQPGWAGRRLRFVAHGHGQDAVVPGGGTLASPEVVLP